MYDLLIKGGRVIDPSQSLDAIRDIGILEHKVASLQDNIPAQQAKEVLEAEGLIVTPGLIDLHVHIYEEVSFYGINADENCLNRGVTTVADAGTSGALTFSRLREQIIETSKTNILAFLHLSSIGLRERYGELKNLDLADTEAAFQTIDANRDVICGIKVRMEPNQLGDQGDEVHRLVRELSERAGLPIMFHIGQTTPPLPKILEESKPGDIITHCFHGRQGGILDAENRILPEVWDAAQRGVIFDIGHGFGSFKFLVARTALEQGFYPTTISSDLHTLSINGPVFDLTTTMSKFLYLGIPLNKVIDMTTWKPAQVLGVSHKKGTLRPGAHADVTLLKLIEGPISLSDAYLEEPIETVTASEYLKPYGVVREGTVVFMGREMK